VASPVGSFDFTSWYAAIIYFVGGLLVLAAGAEKLYGWGRWLYRRARPVRPEPPIPPPVYISEQIGSSTSTAHEPGAPHRHLSRISPRYEIHNGGGDHTIRNVTTGVRRRGSDTGGHQFDWFASDIQPLKHRLVKDVEIPSAMFRDVHESVGIEAFVVWARFTDAAGRPWEVTRDAHTKAAGEQLAPPPFE
jgi:hypothetical protein